MGEYNVYDKSKFTEKYTYASGDMELLFDVHYISKTIAIRHASIECDDEFILEAWRLAKSLIETYHNEIQ